MIDLNNLIEETQVNNNDETRGYISVILFSFGILSRALMFFINDYDIWFKGLSLMSLALVCLVNAGKLIEILYNSFNRIVTIFKKKKK